MCLHLDFTMCCSIADDVVCPETLMNIGWNVRIGTSSSQTEQNCTRIEY